jgi:DNA-binding SARP family transcriptional activator/tetratricopeptide (TPR) repeat protein
MNALPTNALNINLLGQLTAVYQQHDPTTQLSRKTRALLAYLAATDRAHSRPSLQTLFCQQANDPAGSLRWHLSRLRRALGKDLLVETAVGLRLNPEIVWVDSRVFGQVMDQPLSQADPDELRRVLALYRDEFLTGLALPDSPEFELWLLGQRAHYRRLALKGWRYLADYAAGAGNTGEAIGWLQTLLRHEPLREEAHAHLIRLYAQTGQRQAALHQYELCADLLRAELAVEPTAELQALYQDVRHGRSQSPGPQPAVAAPSRPQSPPGFVGRRDELNRLAALTKQAAQGQGSVLLLAAPAGGGKTRLLQEFARSSNVTLLTGLCYESTRHLPYHPWLEILEQRLANLSTSHLEQFPRFWLERLAWLLPPLATRLGLTVTPPAAEGEAEQLWLAMAHLLFAQAEPANAPVLLFLDDLQWADEASLHLFHFLALRVGERPFLFIGAFREEEASETTDLLALVSDLQRADLPLSQWRLSPLSPAAIAELTAERWSQLPAGYRPHVAALLARATGGNPFFLTELLHELAHGADLPQEMPVPDSVQELVGRRLQQLPDSSRQVIEALAVLDAPATPNQVRQISSRSEEETVTAVEHGLRYGLLRTTDDQMPARYTFPHDLVGQAVSAQLSRVRRQLLHRRCATLLVEEASRLRPVERAALAGRIARHAWQSETLELVWQWARPAAAHAHNLYAYDNALSFYEMATAAFASLHADPQAAGSADRLHFIDCCLHRILLGAAAGRPLREQQPLLQEMAALLAQYPHEPQQALFHLCQATVWNGAGEYERAAVAAQQGYETYRQLSDLPLAARCLVQAGEAKIRLSQNRAGQQLLEQALILYETAVDEEGMSRCRSGLAWAALNLGEVEVALDHLHQALAVNQAQHDRLGEARIAYTLAAAWLYYYHAANVRRYARQASALFHQIGYKTMVTRTLIYEGLATRIEGDWEAAAATFSQVLDAATEASDLWLDGWTAQALGRIRLRQGDLAEAERLFQHARRLRQQSGETQNLVSDLAWLGRLRLAQKRPAEALHETAVAVQQVEAAQGQFYVWETPDVYLCHAEALLANGRSAAAQTAIQAAYDALQAFAAQIKDPAVKASFMAHWTSVRIIEAKETGKIRPFAKIR